MLLEHEEQPPFSLLRVGGPVTKKRTTHIASNCLKLLAHSQSKPFNSIFKEELAILNETAEPIFNFKDEPNCKLMGIGKFPLKTDANIHHSALANISVYVQKNIPFLFFNVYANAGGRAITANYPTQLSTRLPLFWVYMDCIINQITGAGASPVLRTIPVNRIDGDENSKISVINFDDPYYVEINKRLIDVISCEICMENGKPVKFPQGSRTLFILHVRKRQRFLVSL